MYANFELTTLAAEKAILQHVADTLALNIDRAANPDRVDPMVVMRADIEAEQRKMDKLIDLSLTMDDPKVLAGRINACRQSIERLNQEMRRVTPAGAQDSDEFLRLIDAFLGIRGKLTGEDRQRIQVELRRLVKKIEFECEGADGFPHVHVWPVETELLDEELGPLTRVGADVLSLEGFMEQVGGNRRKLKKIP